MKLLVIGAGGHAKVVIDAARAAGVDVVGVAGKPGDPSDVLGIPVTLDRSAGGAEAFIVAVGDNKRRAEEFATWLATGLEPVSVIHPSAILSDDVDLGRGVFVAPGVIVNVGAHIGDNVILNTGCRIDHDTEIGDHAHIGPNVALCGGVVVGEGALLGVNSCVIPLGRVGAWSQVGAGAAVTREVPADETWAGVPARAIREGDGE